MLYIFCALYDEAKPFIEKYNLSGNSEFHHYRVFTDWDGDDHGEGKILSITGSGILKAAMAVTEICARVPPARYDRLLNVGIAGTADEGTEIGDTFLVNRIIDDMTKKEYYPDIVYNPGVREKTLCTVVTPGYFGDCLTDMEGAGIYAAGEKFFSADRMIFVKAVSDVGSTENVTRELIGKCTAALLKATEGMIEKNECMLSSERSPEERVEQLAEDMRLSVTMKESMKQLFRFMILEGQDVSEMIDKVYRENDMPVTSKIEGKRIYDGIYETVFSYLR